MIKFGESNAKRILKYISGMPAVDVVPVVHSKWGICCNGYDEIMAFSKQLTALHKAISGYDAAIMQKRKAMFDIEKENCMTVAAALRSIPKTAEKEENPLINALMNDDG